MTDKARIKEVFADEEFVKELFSKETPEEVQVLLAEKDIDLTGVALRIYRLASCSARQSG